MDTENNAPGSEIQDVQMGTLTFVEQILYPNAHPFSSVKYASALDAEFVKMVSLNN